MKNKIIFLSIILLPLIGFTQTDTIVKKEFDIYNKGKSATQLEINSNLDKNAPTLLTITTFR